MKRASYREAIAWIGDNDDAGSDDARDPEVVRNYVTSCLIADIFGVAEERVGATSCAIARGDRTEPLVDKSDFAGTGYRCTVDMPFGGS